MKALYVDCFSGISGDMFLGALVDLGLEIAELRAAIGRLPIEGYRVECEAVTRQGIAGRAVRVVLDDRGQQPTRHLSDVEAIIRTSDLTAAVKDRACQVFRALAEAEASVHGVSVENVHFHEVGAVDAIVDVVGATWGLQALGIEKVFASSLPSGSGTVQTAHGPLPVPAPATLALLARRGAPLRPSPATTELVTPTGAALLATLATFEQPELRLARVGYGFGQKTLPWPNVVRLWLGDLTDDRVDTDTIGVIEANLDDERPEILGATMQTLLAAGALDVFFTPIQMKKNRPAVKLSVLCPLEKVDALSAVVILETSTLGVRTYQARRLKSQRWQERVPTPWGDVLVKVKEFGNARSVAPEYEDCLRLAREANVPLAEVYQVAKQAWSAARSVRESTC
ncbi:MAG: nickel pincer cofactor biosynthesis protein LarC [Chloroflexota bacterium]